MGMNFCSSCREDFSSIAAFDKHRIGKHEYDFSAKYPDGRRCMSVDEIAEAGMARDKYERWQLVESAESARRHFGGGS